MNIPVWVAWLLIVTAAYCILKALWSGFIITFLCPKRGDVIRYIDYQNTGWNSWVRWGRGK